MQLYFEEQDGQLCAVHCLNTLLQGPYFTAVDLMEIGHQFDQQERSMMEGQQESAEDEDFGNVDDTGFYSVQVLQRALEVFGLALTRSTSARGNVLLAAGALGQQAFIANQGLHWLAVRKMDNGEWWNFDSTLPRPQFLSDFYLQTYLDSLVASNYDLFIVEGELPSVQPGHLGAAGGNGKWLEANKEPIRSEGDQTAQINRLAANLAAAMTGSVGSASQGQDESNLNPTQAEEDDEDAILQSVLQQSLMEQ